MKACIIHGDRVAREILGRAFRRSFDAFTASYSCCEDVLKSSLDYDIFVVYNNFGPREMSGIKGTAAIRARKSDAYIIGVSSKPYNNRRFLPAGANVFLLRAGNEIGELIEIVRRQATPGQARAAAGVGAT